MIYPSKRLGFTLVELLVVMTIMVTATALAGGLVVDGVKKFQAKAELQELEQLFIQASAKAFVLEKRLFIELGNDRMEIYSDNGQILAHTFSYLIFRPASFNVNKLGLVDKSRIVVVANGNEKKIDLNDIYNNATTF